MNKQDENSNLFLLVHVKEYVRLCPTEQLL